MGRFRFARKTDVDQYPAYGKAYAFNGKRGCENPKPKREVRKGAKRMIVSDNEIDEDSMTSNLSEDEDYAPYVIYEILYGDESKKYKPHWLSCDQCNKWTFVICLKKNFDVNFCLLKLNRIASEDN